ncbi:MAG: hypothetical protein KAJ19_05615 [Gammaproteobacteria bacterium]|nr:hypothetical protein [Gammaproteobacteria bacterium]
MKIFKFEAPITQAIKDRFIATVSSLYADAEKRNLFISHEPPEGEVFSYADDVNDDGLPFDGAVAVYADVIDPKEGSSTETGEQETFSLIHVDCYGYGDVFKKGGTPQKSSISAQRRAQVLTSVAYEAITDALQFENAFGTGIRIAEKLYAGTEKVGAMGVAESNRTICFYRSKFRIRLEEDIPTEPLGPAYDGGNITQETENP